jgi:hypothetical protein
MILTSPWIDAQTVQTMGVKPLSSNVCMKFAIGNRWPHDCICAVHTSFFTTIKAYFAVQGMWVNTNISTALFFPSIRTSLLDEAKDAIDKILIENDFVTLTETDWQKACLLR